SLILGYLTVNFALTEINGFLTTLSCLTVFVLSTVYIRKCGLRPTPRQWILGAGVCLFSCVFSITASGLLHVLNCIFLIGAQFWWIEAVAVKARFVTKYFLFDLIFTVFVQPLCDFGAVPRAIKASAKGSKKAAGIGYAILGLIITIPLTFIVALLLSSADEGVNRMLVSITEYISEDIFTTLFRIILAIPVGFLIFSSFRADEVNKLYPLPSDVRYHEAATKAAKLPPAGILAGVTPICILYLIYFISQANYFLSAFSGVLPENMRYSQYARQGFFELCAVAAINLVVITIMLTLTKKHENGRCTALTIYSTLICIFTLFIISTALAKMFMYIGEYGLSRLRLYTAWFMILLAAVFMILLIRGFVPRFRTSSALTSVFVILFGILCFSRPDALIAQYNISLYEQGVLETLDMKMLCELSDDSYIVMLDHYDTVKDIEWELYPGLPGSDTAVFDDALSERLDQYRENPFSALNLSSQLVIISSRSVSAIT
ncbi:MAG: DUF4173 domain-containing protein, partial [Ruminiclostridium sp.]|nr:DUF4173 domain-containing protein [Ruminiclostridium sp.]